MNNHPRRAAVVFILASVLLMLAPSRVGVPTSGAKAQTATPAQTREEAYRANNLGVALLEQFKHKEGADQFRRALALDPRLALARINLAVALLNVPDAAAARKEAIAAAVAAPDAPQPHYVLGLLAKSENKPDEALAAFQRVLKIDPRDVGANVQVGQLYAQQRKYTEAIAAFRTALNEEPYNGTALYNLGTALLRAGQREEGQRLVQQFQALRQSGAATIIGQNYLEQGRYAEAVASTGAEPDLVDRRTPEVSFVEATKDVLPAAPTSGVGPKVLGGGPTLFDADGDGDLDLVEAAGASPRLYRNDAGKFSDVSAQAGALSKAAGGALVVAGDYDNDERADLLLVREGALALFRNEGALRFADATAAARVPAYPYVSHSAAFVDYDHDGDLDIFVAGLADRSKSKTPGQDPRSVGFLTGFAAAPHLLLRNNGDGTFADQTAAAKLTRATDAQAVAVVPTDYDNRRDVDLLVVHSYAPPALYRNLRDSTFRDVAAEVGLDLKGHRCASAAAADVNKDGFTDFFFACGADANADSPGVFAMSDGKGRFKTSAAPRATNYATDAQFFDYDNDGLLDLVALYNAAAGGALAVLRNTGDGWADVSERAAGTLSGAGLVADSFGFAAGDVDGDGDTDIFARSDAGGVKFLRNEGGNKNASVRVRLAGKVSNRTGVGAKVEARAGSLWQKTETYSAAPAPAPSDVLFGLGRRTTVDAVRVLWPAGIVQAETDIKPAASSSASRNALSLTVTELDRKPSSCPYLYTWNGERFEFVTDFMGGGELGYWAAPGVRAQPDPDEYVLIRGDQLKERDGRYELRVTNELEEALFIDRLQLVAVAHPAGVAVHPNEGLGNPTRAAFKLHVTRDARPPRAATDEHGHDVLPRVARLDRTYPDDFRLHALRGYADEHTLTLDLGGDDRRATDDESAAVIRQTTARVRTAPPSSSVPRHSVLSPQSSVLLLMTGWTDYAFSSDNVAASQTGRTLRAPALQVRDAEGNWRTVVENIGIPVGRPQTVAVELAGKFLSPSREVRVVTNMRIYWDQILVATADASDVATSPRVERLDAATADLRWRGFSAETTPDGREPYLYDYDRVSFDSPWKTLPGRYTRLGDVRELLQATDDLFVVSRPGDELAVSFDARALAPLPAGWTRTFLLYADGFSKEMDLNSASPDALAPLPFHRMKSYPYAAPEAYPSTPAHRAYVERYNTRVVNSQLGKVVSGRWPVVSERQDE